MIGRSCNIIPVVTDEEGISVDSKLFTDLLSYTNNNRVEAKRIYMASKSIDITNFPKDENGELTFEAAVQLYNSIIDSDPVRTFMTQNKIKIQGRDLIKSYPDLKKLRKQFPNYIFSARQDSGGYTITYYNNTFANRAVASDRSTTVNDDRIKYTEQELRENFNYKTPEEALENIIKISNDPEVVAMAQRLLPFANKIKKVKIFTDDLSKQKADGIYTPSGGEIFIAENRINAISRNRYNQTVMHEIIHAYTSSALDNPITDAEIKFNDDIERIFNSIKGTNIFYDYGFTNKHEFVAEILTNPQFVENLFIKRPSTLLKIINAIRRLFGLNEIGKLDVDLTRDLIINHISKLTPTRYYSDGLQITLSNKSKHSVLGEINTYLKETKKDRQQVTQLESAILTIHKRIKYDIGKTNLAIKKLEKEIRQIEYESNLELKKIIDDYVVYNGGVFNKGYERSPLYKNLKAKLTSDLLPVQNEIDKLELYKDALNNDIADLSSTNDVRQFELDYQHAATKQMDNIEDKIYNLDNPVDIEELSNDYNFLHLFSKFEGMSSIKPRAEILINKLTNNFVSPFISKTATGNLNLEGLDEKLLDVNDLMKINPDITLLEKYFRGLGDYPRLEAQLIHSLTVEGTKRARSDSEKIGEEIHEHKRKLVKWAKKNKIGVNAFGIVNLNKVYELLYDINHQNRLDLVKPYTVAFYREVNEKLKTRYNPLSTPAERGAARSWLKKNYYNPTANASYFNPRYTYIQSQSELLDFYEFFKEKVAETYEKLPEYIDNRNKEKIPTLVKEAIFQWFGLSPANILKSIRLAGKTLLFGSGTPVFYNEEGELEDKFTIKELTQDQVRLKMLGEVEANKKSRDLGEVLFQFYSFGNDYEQMTKVLPIARLVQNLIAKKRYGDKGITGSETRINAAFDLYIDKTITKTDTQDSVPWTWLGEKIYDNNGDEIGETQFYWSTLVRHLITYTRVLQLGFNLLSAAGNLFAGLSSNVTEATGKQFYGVRDYIKGLSIYLGDAFVQRTKWLRPDVNMTKVELLSDLIQPLDEIAEYDIRKEVKVKSSNVVINSFNYVYDNTFILQQLGEDVIHKSSMVAYLLATKIVGTDSKKHSLWSLFSVVNDQLVFNSALAGNNDVEKFIKHHKNTIININSKNQGDYSKDNASVHSNQVAYQVAILFRKWLPAMIADRLQDRRYNYKTGKWDEGFFKTGSRVITKTFTNTYIGIMGLISDNTALLASKKDITKEEMIGIRKIAGDLIQIMVFTFLPLLLMPPPEDDDDYAWWLPNALQDWFYDKVNLGIYKNKNQFNKSKDPATIMVKYMSDHSNRIATDRLQFYNVFKYPEIVSRMALYQTFVDLGQAVYSIGDLAFGEENNKQIISRGINKGEYKALKEFRDIVPYWKQYDKVYKQTKKKAEDLQK